MQVFHKFVLCVWEIQFPVIFNTTRNNEYNRVLAHYIPLASPVHFIIHDKNDLLY